MRNSLLLSRLRLLLVGVHLLNGAFQVALLFHLGGASWRQRLKRIWSRQLLMILGIRVEAGMDDLARIERGLLVGNHISFIDIFVINALLPCAFVAKSEVARWPLIGWLSRRTDTVFIERGSASAARRANEALTGHLGSNRVVAAFPEGTTSDGMALLPFRSALLQAAIDAQSVVQPIALSYLDATGRRTPVAAYCGDVTLWQSLCDIASAPGLTVRAEVLPPLSSLGRTRRELGEHAQHLIGTALGRLAPSCAAHGAGALASPVEALA
jgi:1-acyl-sn-glycerol-3-phosphate acyltransferase